MKQPGLYKDYGARIRFADGRPDEIIYPQAKSKDEARRIAAREAVADGRTGKVVDLWRITQRGL